MRNKKQHTYTILHEMAEELLKKNSTNSGSQIHEANITKLIHKLEVHQIELEMQKEELILANELAKNACDKYTKLYDFNPTGYFTLSPEGRIVEMNFSGTELLGKERSLLKNTNFNFFVSESSKSEFDQFINKVFARKEKIVSEISLMVNGNCPVYVFLTGIATENGKKCLLTATDITEKTKSDKIFWENEIRYRELFNNINSGVAVYEVKDNGKDFIFKDLNRAGELIDNNKREELIGKSIFEIRKGIQEFGLVDVLKRVWKTGKPEYLPIKQYRDNKLIQFYDNFVYKLPSGELVTVFNDLTQQKKLKEEKEQTQEKLRDFTTMLQKSLEEERKSIAREIHDEFGQVLTALKMNLTMLGSEVNQTDKRYSKAAIENEITNMKSIIDHTIRNVRDFTNKLRPDVLDTFGLVEALDAHISEFSQQYTIKCTFKPCEEIDVKMDKSIAVYRIVQEALTNVARHAHATEVNVNLIKLKDILFLSIEDNGIGMIEKQKDDEKKFGIIGMKERAYICGGNLTVTNRKDKGTIVELNIPVK